MPKRPYSQSDPDTRVLIRRERLAKGMTQEELAEKLDTSPVTVGRYETGERQVTVTKLIEIADALGVPPARLIRDGDGLTAEEREMIDWLRSHPRDRTVLLSTLKSLRQTSDGAADGQA